MRSVNGNLCVDEVNTSASLNAGGVGATAAGTAPGAGAAALQSILLQLSSSVAPNQLVPCTCRQPV